MEEEVKFDRQRIQALSDPKTKTILTFNLTQKLMIQAQLKTLRVAKEMLIRIQRGDPFSSACVKPVEDIED